MRTIGQLTTFILSFTLFTSSGEKRVANAGIISAGSVYGLLASDSLRGIQVSIKVNEYIENIPNFTLYRRETWALR